MRIRIPLQLGDAAEDDDPERLKWLDALKGARSSATEPFPCPVWEGARASRRR